MDVTRITGLGTTCITRLVSSETTRHGNSGTVRLGSSATTRLSSSLECSEAGYLLLHLLLHIGVNGLSRLEDGELEGSAGRKSRVNSGGSGRTAGDSGGPGETGSVQMRSSSISPMMKEESIQLKGQNQKLAEHPSDHWQTGVIRGVC